MSAKVFTVAQQKGGAGKTTLAVHLAVAFLAMKKSVAAVDIDPQQSLSLWFRLRAERIGDEAAGLTLRQIGGWRARAEIQSLLANHDVVVVDSPPHAETEAKIAVRSADLVIVPVQPSPMDVWATRPTLALAAAEKVPALLVLNRVPARAKLTEEMLAEIKHLGARVAKARIGNRVAFAAALSQGQAVGESNPRSKAAREIAALAKEIWRKS